MAKFLSCTMHIICGEHGSGKKRQEHRRKCVIFCLALSTGEAVSISLADSIFFCLHPSSPIFLRHRSRMWCWKKSIVHVELSWDSEHLSRGVIPFLYTLVINIAAGTVCLLFNCFLLSANYFLKPQSLLLSLSYQKGRGKWVAYLEFNFWLVLKHHSDQQNLISDIFSVCH